MVRKWDVRIYVFQVGVNLSAKKAYGMALGVTNIGVEVNIPGVEDSKVL